MSGMLFEPSELDVVVWLYRHVKGIEIVQAFTLQRTSAAGPIRSSGRD